MLRIQGNQRFPFGMDENIWEAKENRSNNPVINIPPTPPLPHIKPHSGRRKTQKIQRRAQGQGRGEISRAGERGVVAGAEARKPRAHTAAMTYCDLRQVTAAYERISSSEHGQEDFCLAEGRLHGQGTTFHPPVPEGPEGESSWNSPVSRLSGPPEARRTLDRLPSLGASPMTSEAAPGLKQCITNGI